MKRLFACALAALFFMAAVSSQAVVKKAGQTVVFGTGGQIIEPDGTIRICPKPSRDTCAILTQDAFPKSEFPDLIVTKNNGSTQETQARVVSAGSSGVVFYPKK